MVEMVSSVVIQEYEEKEETNAIRNLIREARDGTHQLEAAVETSNKWQITDTSMLHWQKKLKRAAQDKKLHKCKLNFIINKASLKKCFVPNI
jgi:flavin-binding protein dodecin